MMSAKPVDDRRADAAPLLVLYLWPFWMFKDADRGTLFDRAAAYRHNCEQRIFLPGYVVKWSVLLSLLLATTYAFECLGGAYWAFKPCCDLLAAATGILASLAAVVIAVITVAYFFLARRHTGD